MGATIATLALLALAIVLAPGPASGAAPPQRGYALGSPRAPVEIREFADLQCPVCREAHRRTLPTVIRQLVVTGKARLVFRPLAFIGPDSLRGAQAAVAAARQDRVWPLVDALYRRQGFENSGWLSDALVRSTARSVPGLGLARFERQRAGRGGVGDLRRVQDEAVAAGVRGTPTFVVRGPRGTRVLAGAVPPSQIAAAAAAVR